MKYKKITISGRICTGKSSLFRTLAQKLKYPTFSSSQLFREHAQELGISLETAAEQEAALTKQIDDQITEFLQTHDQALVEGWMAGIKSQGIPGVLRIFLTCDDHERFARFAKREHCSIEEAQRKVLERERNWLQRLSRIYEREDFFAPKHYDWILDTTQIDPQKTVEKTLEKINASSLRGM